MTTLKQFLHNKIMDCESVFENANTNTTQLWLEGMLKHGGETNALLMCIGKRQAYMEIMDYLRGNTDE